MTKTARPEEQSSPHKVDFSNTAAVGPLIDAKELSDLLGVSTRLVQKLAAQGSIPHHRVGDLIRFSLADVLNATGRTVRCGGGL